MHDQQKFKVEEMVLEMAKKSTATWEIFSNLRIIVLTYYMRVVTCFVGGALVRRGD
jgi:hypothetical protein